MSSARADAPSFVCFSIFDWWYHGRGHSDFQLMQQLAERHDVLLVNSLGMRLPLPSRSDQTLRRVLRKARSATRGLRTPVAGLPRYRVLSPLSVPAYGSSPLRRLNAASVAAQVRLAMRRQRIDDPVVVVTVPTALDVVERLPHRRLVYNRSDKHSAFTEADRPLIEALERELLARADVVLYASRTLLREEAALVGDRALLLDHAVDAERFGTSAPEPPDLAGIPHPRIGFLGELRDRVIDLDLLEALAVRLPDVQLVLVGAATSDVRRLTEHRNVHWLGFRAYDQIPAYAQALDVGLLPYRATEWVQYVDPIKLREYQAAGLPAVSTDFPAAREHPGAIAVAADEEAFVAEVRRCLATPPAAAAARRSELQRRVSSASWRGQAERLLSALDRP